jgi:hypothetical protein
MIFWLCVFAPLGVLLVGVPFAIKEKTPEPFAVSAVIAAILALILAIPVGCAWTDHGNDLGTIEAQDQVIAVYEQQVTQLKDELQAFHYQPGSLLNADSPVASVVKSLTDVQEQLTAARVKKAEAVLHIEQRRRGPMSGVITVAGDYKH